MQTLPCSLSLEGEKISLRPGDIMVIKRIAGMTLIYFVRPIGEDKDNRIKFEGGDNKLLLEGPLEIAELVGSLVGCDMTLTRKEENFRVFELTRK